MAAALPADANSMAASASVKAEVRELMQRLGVRRWQQFVGAPTVAAHTERILRKLSPALRAQPAERLQNLIWRALLEDVDPIAPTQVRIVEPTMVGKRSITDVCWKGALVAASHIWWHHRRNHMLATCTGDRNPIF